MAGWDRESDEYDVFSRRAGGGGAGRLNMRRLDRERDPEREREREWTRCQSRIHGGGASSRAAVSLDAAWGDPCWPRSPAAGAGWSCWSCSQVWSAALLPWPCCSHSPVHESARDDTLGHEAGGPGVGTLGDETSSWWPLRGVVIACYRVIPGTGHTSPDNVRCMSYPCTRVSQHGQGLYEAQRLEYSHRFNIRT